MASISKDSGGNRRIQFVDVEGVRKTIRLGKMPQRSALEIKTRIEHLLAAKKAGCAWDGPTAEWVATRGDDLADKLARVGLIPPRPSARLGGFLDSYVKSRVDVKEATATVYGHSKRNLIHYFGADKPLRDITPGDADGFRLYLIGEGLAENTVRRRCGIAKQFLRAAERHGFVTRNPFADLVSTVQATPDRLRFISLEETASILAKCPCHDWRLIVALARYGGLRCPSEVLSLTWQEIDWEAQRIRVISPKTERHPGKESRVIPLFPELRPYLEESFARAIDGAVYVVDERFRRAAVGPTGWRNCNLRTTFEKIVRRAGLAPWPRLFHNLRSSRETELSEQFPIHVVTAWLGNTLEVARKHYLQVTDEHFRLATEPATGAAQKAAQCAAESSGKRSYQEQQIPVIPEEYRTLLHCTSIQMGDEGLEPPTSSV
jgi:integrase